MVTLLPVKGYEGLYEVDSMGNVYSCVQTSSRRKGKLKPCNRSNHYLYVNLYKDGKATKYFVHRLVAEAFIPNLKRLPEVNHIDGNKQNNSVDNLEWCTRSQNTSHAFKTGLRNYNGCKNPHSKLTQSDVETIRRIYVRGKHCENNSYGLAKRYNVSPKTIQNVVNGKHY